MKRAVFLDRDGTIIEEVGYLREISQIRFINGAIEAIKRLNDNDYLVIVVTNQSGIARGYFTEERLLEIHEYIDSRLRQDGVRIDHWFYCPHHKEGIVIPYNIECDCRKPRTGMIARALEMFKIDKSNSFVVGDSVRDVFLGINSGLRPILVLTGYGLESLNDLVKDTKGITSFHVARDILDASRLICGF